MTAENNGTGTTDGDDPFGYLYRSEGGTTDTTGGAPAGPPPRRPYQQVRGVGERLYGAPTPGAGATPGATQQQPGQHQQPGPHQQAGSPSPHYAAPETLPGGRAAARRAATPAPRLGGNRNGLLIGAIAVVAAVVIGIGSAMIFNDDSGEPANQAGPTAPADPEPSPDAEEDGPKPSDEKKDDAPAVELPAENAASMRLGGKASVQSEIAGAKADGGAYVAGMEQPGSTVEWSFQAPEAGKYTVFVGYGVPGKDADATITVNGEPQTRPLNLSNFAGAPANDWTKGWTQTYAQVTLAKGENKVAVSCGQGNQCSFALDRMWLKSGWPES